MRRQGVTGRVRTELTAAMHCWALVPPALPRIHLNCMSCGCRRTSERWCPNVQGQMQTSLVGGKGRDRNVTLLSGWTALLRRGNLG